TFQAIRYHFAMNAAATVGAYTSLEQTLAADSMARKAMTARFPDYERQSAAMNAKRSAILWPSELRTPLLLMHGGADTEVSPLQTLDLAEALERLKMPYSLIIYAGDNHGVSKNRLDRDARAVAWFRDHMKQ